MAKNDFSDRNLLLRVAILYYEKDMTQEQISHQVGVSRPQVSKLLQAARDQHLVEFFVKDIDKHIVELELQLQEKYNLTFVRVISTRLERSQQAVSNQVGFCAALYLEAQLPQVKALGIGWGNAVSHFVNEVDYIVDQKVTVVPLVGGFCLLNLDIHANYLVAELAAKLRAKYFTFYAPVIADSAQEAKELRETSLVSSALKAARNVDIAFIGIGNNVENSTWQKLDYISPSEIKELQDAHAVGDIVANFIDSNGEPVETEFSDRLIGITIDDLKAIPNVVAMAVGAEKVQSLKALLKKHIINSLVIDQDIAEQVI